jgi:hypothetical protein
VDAIFREKVKFYTGTFEINNKRRKMSFRSNNYTLIDEISESESDDGSGPEGYYGRKKTRGRQGYHRGHDDMDHGRGHGSERVNERANERANGRSERANERYEKEKRRYERQDERKVDMRLEQRKKAEVSETEMNRLYAGHPAPRANTERVAEINDGPLVHAESYGHASTSRDNNMVCSKCSKRISLWSLIADEMSSLVVLVLILVLLYFVYRGPRVDAFSMTQRMHRPSGQEFFNPSGIESAYF